MIGEIYIRDGDRILRRLAIGSREFASWIEDVSSLGSEASPWERWWRSYLRGARPSFHGTPVRPLNIVDLFSGCGGLALGTHEAARAAGLRPLVRLAVDTDRQASRVYAANLAPRTALCADVTNLADYKISGWAETARFAYPPEPVHPELRAVRGYVDLVIAGPPCEGHSNLNNRTRHADPRNLLYLDAIAVAVALNATAVVVENVPAVVNDRRRVVDTAIALLEGQGFRTTQAVLAAHELGLPQTRSRFFLVGSRKDLFDLRQLAESLRKQPTTVRWAIEDLLDVDADPIMDAVPVLSPENRLRIDYLFDNDLYDLPDSLRPRCHRNGHTYPSVYGRLRWDAPAGTITTGFFTPGRGRFIHPSRRRPLTAREAARLQGFPDWYRFQAMSSPATARNALAKWIGDAVPPLLGYIATLSVLSGILQEER